MRVPVAVGRKHTGEVPARCCTPARFWRQVVGGGWGEGKEGERRGRGGESGRGC